MRPSCLPHVIVAGGLPPLMQTFQHLPSGGVFEEAIYMASMLLEPECRITQTVRNADIIDNTFRVWPFLKLLKTAQALDFVAKPPWPVASAVFPSCINVHVASEDVSTCSNLFVEVETEFMSCTIRKYLSWRMHTSFDGTIMESLRQNGPCVNHLTSLLLAQHAYSRR